MQKQVQHSSTKETHAKLRRSKRCFQYNTQTYMLMLYHYSTTQSVWYTPNFVRYYDCKTEWVNIDTVCLWQTNYTYTPEVLRFFSNKSSSRSVLFFVFFFLTWEIQGSATQPGSTNGPRDHPRPWSIVIKTWRLQWRCSSAPTRCFDSNWMPLEELKSMGIFWERTRQDYGILGWRFGENMSYFSPRKFGKWSNSTR